MVLRTDCYKCVFSTWSDADTHTGCELNVLPIYMKKGKVNQQTFEDGLTILTIEGELCPKFRNDLWFEQYKNSWVDRLQFECRIGYEAYILVDKDTQPSDISKTVESIIEQTPTPVGVSIINYFSTIPTNDLLPLLYRYELPNPTLHMVLDEEYKIGDAIDLGIKNTKGNYILITKAGVTLPTEFVKYAQTNTFEDMNRIAALVLDEDNFLMDKELYKIEKYNFMEDIVKKYPEYSKKWQDV